MLHDPNTLPPLAPEVEASLEAQMPSDQARYMARKYFKDWGKQSPHLEGRAITMWPALMIHARGEEEALITNTRLEERMGRNERRKARTEREGFSAEWMEWQRQCTLRNNWIEQANLEWRRLVAERGNVLRDLDARVAIARTEYTARKATQAPPQPVKVAQ